MSNKKFYNGLLSSNGIKFMFYPIVFLFIGTLSIYLTFSSALKSFDSILELFMYNEVPTFEQKENLMLNAIDNGDIVIPSPGQQFAEIKIESVGISANVFYGDSSTELLKGVGCYTGAHIPGQRSTVMMCAHNNSHFHTLGEMSVGDKINIKTNYGNYVYQMTGSKVAKATDDTAYDLFQKEENLILYTCYPFDELRLTPDRYFVYAKYVSGPLKKAK